MKLEQPGGSADLHGAYFGCMLRAVACLHLLCALPISAQNWCPPGATWTYEAVNDNGGFLRFSYDRDTLIGSEEAQVIDLLSATQQAPVFGEPVYAYIPVAKITKEEGDVVYDWNGQSWDTLYWFAATPGNGYTAAHQWCSPFMILQTGTELFGGIPLDWHSVGPVHRIYERFGYTWHTILACPGVIILQPAALRCYSDDQISVQFSGENCEAFVGVETRSNQLQPPFPNPGTDHFTLQLANGEHTIEVFDATGRSVLREQTIGVQPMIDTSTLPPGIYLVQVDDVAVGRWLKE